MATSFGDADGGAPDIRRLLANPWVLGAAAAAVVLGIFIFRQTRGGGAAVGTQVPTAAGLPNSGVASTDQLGLQAGGIQDQLGNLAQQISAGFSGQSTQNVTPANFSVVQGQFPGQDPGTYFGAAPTNIPAGDTLVWRWTSTYLQSHPELGAGWGKGYGPPGPPQQPFSWEWAVLPSGQLPGGGQ